MRIVLMMLALASCAPTTPAAIYATPVELTIPSSKSPKAFATCVADALPDAGAVMNDGDHFWLSRRYGGEAFERWDFTPTATGSIAERRSGRALASFGTGKVRKCAD